MKAPCVGSLLAVVATLTSMQVSFATNQQCGAGTMVPCENLVLADPWPQLENRNGTQVCKGFVGNQSPSVLSRFAACSALIQPAISMAAGGRGPANAAGNSCNRSEPLQPSDFPGNSCRSIVKKQGTPQLHLETQTAETLAAGYPHLQGRGDVLTAAFYSRSPITGKENLANLHFVMRGSSCELADANFDGLRLTPEVCQALDRGPLRPCSTTVTENCFEDPGALQRKARSHSAFVHCLNIRINTNGSRPLQHCLSMETVDPTGAALRDRYGMDERTPVNHRITRIDLQGARMNVVLGNSQESRIEQKPISEYLKFKIQQARSSCALLFPAQGHSFQLPVAGSANPGNVSSATAQ